MTRSETIDAVRALIEGLDEPILEACARVSADNKRECKIGFTVTVKYDDKADGIMLEAKTTSASGVKVTELMEDDQLSFEGALLNVRRERAGEDVEADAGTLLRDAARSFVDTVRENGASVMITHGDQTVTVGASAEDDFGDAS